MIISKKMFYLIIPVVSFVFLFFVYNFTKEGVINLKNPIELDLSPVSIKGIEFNVFKEENENKVRVLNNEGATCIVIDYIDNQQVNEHASFILKSIMNFKYLNELEKASFLNNEFFFKSFNVFDLIDKKINDLESVYLFHQQNRMSGIPKPRITNFTDAYFFDANFKNGDSYFFRVHLNHDKSCFYYLNTVFIMIK